ncbi:polyprenol reductase [Megalops cyprinoides]|uniref:polyprenol reductase n=1 Tax=Megalops cyprinoides TaxID=118141 RepID=UPI001864DFDF|nr:polyprenol reductase [Megalops cyprinoides]
MSECQPQTGSAGNFFPVKGMEQTPSAMWISIGGRAEVFLYSCTKVFQDLIRYGKTKNLQRPGALRVFDVPKRCCAIPAWVEGYEVLGVSASAVLVQVLLWTHSLRRLWECVRVSVFSDGVIHAVQYVFGLGYYVILGLTVLCADALHPQTGGPASSLLSQLQWFHAAGVLLFLWASLHQHRCLRLLAQLRTENSGEASAGELVTLGHKVPHGGWFEVVSCPHYFAELLIYVSLGITCRGGALTWWLVVLYVFFNQALAAQLCHEFYCSRFQSYPQQRKAFVPFLL